MKKVLHILTSNTYSGAENVIISIINGLNDKFRFAYSSGYGDIRHVLEKNAIIYLPQNSMSVKEVRRIIKEYSPDIIHAHDFRASVICAMSESKIPIISHLHNNSPWLKEYGLYSWIYLLSAVKFKKILLVSDSVINEYVFGRFIKGKSTIIGNPICTGSILERSKETSEYRFDVAFVGRLAAPKNPFRFIDIIKRLTVEKPDISAGMIGDGELMEECLVKVIDLSLEKNITLTGFLDNPYSVMAKSKILCMTSEWEGFGLVAVEALALGLPVVATPVGGLPGIVNESCGKLCYNNEEFSDTICELLTDSSVYNAKSQGAILRAQELDNYEDYLQIIKMLYDKL